MDDPDTPGGTRVHWVLYNIPANSATLPGNVPTEAILADGSLQGENSWGRSGYGGPCPPGGTHRYSFRLYALDIVLDLGAGATKQELLQYLEGHTLADSELLGTYRRT